MAISLARVSVVSIFVECILYGFFTFMFAVSVYVLLKRRSKTEVVNRPLLVVSVTMFVLATIHVGSDLQRVLDAFLDSPDATKYLSMVNTALYTVKSTAYATQTLVGDGFMLYRLFLIWGGNRRVCFPILICFIASIGVAIGALQGFARASPNAPVFITELHDWIVSFFSLTLFTNFSCTLLIAARIIWVHRRSSGALVGGTSVFPAAMIIIESGMIYSACLIILLSLYLSGSFAQYILLDGVTQVIGIVFSLIIVRVGLGLSTDAATYTSQGFMSTFAARPNADGRSNVHFSVRATDGPQSGLSHNKSRGHKPDIPVTSTFGSMFTSHVDTQAGTFTFSTNDQTESTFSTNSMPTRSGSQKERKVGANRPSSLGYLPEDDVLKRSDDGDTERSFHPFDESLKPSYLEEDIEYAENHELRDQIRVTRTVESHAV
ncbi:hypothetical protein ACEPAH_4040 [Sanghuangporus vaninii]